MGTLCYEELRDIFLWIVYISISLIGIFYVTQCRMAFIYILGANQESGAVIPVDIVVGEEGLWQLWIVIDKKGALWALLREFR